MAENGLILVAIDTELYPYDLFSPIVDRNRAVMPCFSCFQDEAIAQPAFAAIAFIELSLAVT